MPKDVTAYDNFLFECEPYFLDGALTVARFAQQTQEIIRHTVEGRWELIVEALGFTKNEVDLLDYWYPDKFQKAKPMDEIYVGVKLKLSDRFEGAIYRYWIVEQRETGFGVDTWIKGRTKQHQLSSKIDDLPDLPPGPEEAWNFYTSRYGTYFITRSLNDADFREPRLRLEELISYYITVMRKAGGVKHLLA